MEVNESANTPPIPESSAVAPLTRGVIEDKGVSVSPQGQPEANNTLPRVAEIGAAELYDAVQERFRGEVPEEEFRALMENPVFQKFARSLLDTLEDKQTQSQSEVTKLPDKAAMMEDLHSYVYRLVKEHKELVDVTPVFGVAFGDVRMLKVFNDLYDHDLGDRYLKRIAEVIPTVMRQGDKSYHLSGDEFALLMFLRPNAARSVIEGTMDTAENNRGTFVRMFEALEAAKTEIANWTFVDSEGKQQTVRERYELMLRQRPEKVAEALRLNGDELHEYMADVNAGRYEKYGWEQMPFAAMCFGLRAVTMGEVRKIWENLPLDYKASRGELYKKLTSSPDRMSVEVKQKYSQRESSVWGVDNSNGINQVYAPSLGVVK